jgi:hypothetical protein
LTPDDPSDVPGDETTPTLPPAKTRRSLRVPLTGLGVLVLLLILAGVWALIAGLQARTRLEGVRSDLQKLRDDPPARLELLHQLKVDAGKASAARSQMHQLGPAVISHVPFLGRTVTAERTIADAADAVLAAGVPAIEATDGLGGRGSGLDLDRLATLRQVLLKGAADTSKPLKALASLKTGFTPGIVGSSVLKAQTQLGGVANDLSHAASLTDAVGYLLGSHGPKTLYIGLENNAELRGTGGLVSTFALAHAANGRLKIDKFRDSQGIAKVAPNIVPVPAPPAYTAAYGPYLANTTLWLNATMDAHVPSSADVIANLAQHSLGTKPDGVLLLDVAGMAKIVSATGPLHLSDGSTLTGDQLIRALLVTYYGDGSIDQNVQNARHAKLADAASRGFAALESHESDVSVLKALATAASGRHLALWSADPATENELDVAGVSGSTDPHGRDLGLVTVNNLGDSPSFGNKLDYYAKRSFDVHAVVGEHSADVTETLTIANNAPSGLGPYVEGPQHPGRMHLLVSFSASRQAKFEQLNENGKPIGFTTQQMIGSQQVSFAADIERGTTSTWVFEYSVPVTKGHYALRLLPQPLAKAAALTVEVEAAKGSTLGRVNGSADGDWTTSHTLTVDLSHPDWWHRKMTL